MILEHLYHSVAFRVATLHIGPDKFVHVQAGLAVWVGSAWLLRRSLRSRVPLAIVFAAEIANEMADRYFTGSWHWRNTIGDAAATWFWPVVLFALLRFSRRLPR